MGRRGKSQMDLSLLALVRSIHPSRSIPCLHFPDETMELSILAQACQTASALEKAQRTLRPTPSPNSGLFHPIPAAPGEDEEVGKPSSLSSPPRTPTRRATAPRKPPSPPKARNRRRRLTPKALSKAQRLKVTLSPFQRLCVQRYREQMAVFYAQPDHPPLPPHLALQRSPKTAQTHRQLFPDSGKQRGGGGGGVKSEQPSRSVGQPQQKLQQQIPSPPAAVSDLLPSVKLSSTQQEMGVEKPVLVFPSAHTMTPPQILSPFRGNPQMAWRRATVVQSLHSAFQRGPEVRIGRQELR